MIYFFLLLLFQDVLLNNAGLWNTERKETVDKHEATWAVNHLAPFLLTHELIDLLLKAPAGRIVNVSSLAHQMALLNFDDLEWKTRAYNGAGSAPYGTSSKDGTLLLGFLYLFAPILFLHLLTGFFFTS